MNRPLSGRRALVTGSTRGLGLAAVRRLAADGCDVVLHGLDAAAALESVRRGLQHEHGVRVLSSSANLANPPEITALVAACVTAFGGIDILVNNAVVRHTAPVDEFTPQQWDESIGVNLSAAFHTTRLVVADMKQR